MTKGPERSVQTGRGTVARAAALIALGNILSRLLGLARDSAIAHFFGAGGAVSAFGLALRVPQMTYDLLMGGLISAALVPVLSEYTAEARREELWSIASRFCSLATVVLAGAVLLLEGTAPWIVALMGGGFSAGLQEQATTLLRLMAPALLCMGLTGAITGLLYALKRFAFPAFATALFNAGIVAAVLLFHEHLDIASAALGVLVGAMLQLLLQLPGLRGVRLRPTLHFSHPAVGQILRLYLPVLLGVIISMLGTGIDSRLASGSWESTIAWMRNATTLIQTAIGLIATAISLAVLPSLSRAAAEHDEATYRSTLGLGLRLILTLVLPATAVLYALGQPIVALLFEHGEFFAHDTTMVTWALYFYLIGLPFAAVDQLLIFAFYARKDTLRPNLVGAYCIGIYLLFALPLVGQWQMFALVIANSAQWLWHAIFMLLLLRRYIGWPHGERVGATLVRAVAAAAVTGLAAWGTAALVERATGPAGTLGYLTTVAVGGLAALGIYAGLAMLLRLEEVRALWKAFRARWR